MASVGSWRRDARTRLEASGDADAAWDADWMLAEALSCGRAQLTMRKDEPLSDGARRQLDAWLAAREGGEPLQYVTGGTCFMGLDFRCDRRALIPRQDTETLVEVALRRMAGRKNLRVLDMCCGTGAIGLSVCHFRPDALVTLTDISPDALDLARENARLLGLEPAFRQGDLMEAVAGERFDFLLCNPPYLTDDDMDCLMREVRYEPELALRGGADGLSFYRRIAEGLDGSLLPGGEALLEIGRGQDGPVEALLRGRGFDVEYFEDLCGIRRVVRAWRAA